MSGERGGTPAQEPFASSSIGGSGSRYRVSCKLVVIDSKGRVLLTRNRDREGLFYLLPGGGQRFGETLPEAARREAMEETGYSIRPGRLLFVRDYIGASHEFAGEDSDVHQVEVMFEGSLERGAPVGTPSDPDTWQTGVEWVPASSLEALLKREGRRIYPSILSSLLPRLASGEKLSGPTYLGDVN